MLGKAEFMLNRRSFIQLMVERIKLEILSSI